MIGNDTARRLFLARHGLSAPLTGSARGDDLARVIDGIGFVQVDSINTVARAHHMILWSRRSRYRPEALKHLLERDRALFEHWTHDASILPSRLFPFWQHRFQRDALRLRANWQRWFREGYEAQFDTILNRIARDGPVTSAEVGEGEVRGKGGWWDWHPSKTALEWLWRTGALSISRRDGFRKVYDLTERVIPAAHRGPMPDEGDLIDWACRSALERLGFASESELRAYWNALTVAEVRGWTVAALARGEIEPVMIADATGRPRRALAFPGLAATEPPPPLARLRIMSPFDPALRDRDRIEQLFGFHYRIEVFVPEAQRRYGYYVFPVLEGADLIGRLDAKAFRDDSTLRVRGFWPEAGVRMGRQRLARLDAELHRLAAFADCDRVEYLSGWLREH